MKIICVFIIILFCTLYTCSTLGFRSRVFPIVAKHPLIYGSSYQDRVEFLHSHISKYLPKPPAVILNFGCSLNYYSDYLIDKGYGVIALDILDMSASYKSKPVVYDGKNIPKNLVFDCVIITTVLHHIENKTCLNILQDIKSFNKQVIVMEDDYTSIMVPINCMIGNIQFFNHPCNFKTTKEWHELFSKYFTVKEYDETNGFCTFNLYPT